MRARARARTHTHTHTHARMCAHTRTVTDTHSDTNTHTHINPVSLSKTDQSINSPRCKAWVGVKIRIISSPVLLHIDILVPSVLVKHPVDFVGVDLGEDEGAVIRQIDLPFLDGANGTGPTAVHVCSRYRQGMFSNVGNVR